ncbi:MAG TPA: IS1595 family transposase [Pseudolabrys sp.]|nr:IS1595 family transposase [Pseudolabrys sp.]
MSVLSKPYFHDEKAAYAHLEGLLWPEGPTCPHCGNADAKRITRLEGKATRIGVHKCNECRKQFTVKVGTVFESAHVPLHKMLQAVYLMTCSKKGVSAHQLHRILQVTYKTAWFLAHRIREAMKTDGLPPLGGEGKIIESDETYWGPKDVDTDPVMKARRHGKPGPGGKSKIMTLVERGGQSRSVHVADLTNETMARVLLANADRKSRLMTDEGTAPSIGLLFAKHETVKHSANEYARGDVTTNTVEGFFSIFKRGMRGVYQHCSEKHLHRYVAEFDFRYSNRVALGVDDELRSRRALKGVIGKRLTYRAADL